MKRNVTCIAGISAPLMLVFVVASYSAVRESARDLRVRRNSTVLHRDLQLDQKSLASDMRNLRRDLRRQVSLKKIAEERNTVREDWHQVMRDRDPRRPESDALMMELARVISNNAIAAHGKNRRARHSLRAPWRRA